jgi:hypothetical protein
VEIDCQLELTARDRRRRIVPERQAHLFLDVPTLGLWNRWKPARKLRRPTKAQRRNEESRRDPRQKSIFGPGHTEELSGVF